MSKELWEDRYQTGELPWDTGEPDAHLIEVVREYPIRPAKTLEIGCGTGTNALWLAGEGFDVLGVDLSPIAVGMARAKADAGEADAASRARFEPLDFLNDPLPEGPFAFVFDRGCFHVFDEAADRAAFARNVAKVLSAGGTWLSLIGSTEGPERDHGPPRRSLRDVADAVEPALEILDLRTVIFRANTPTPARAWRMLAGKRQVPAVSSTRR